MYIISILDRMQYATMLNNAMIDSKSSFSLISFQLPFVLYFSIIPSPVQRK